MNQTISRQAKLLHEVTTLNRRVSNLEQRLIRLDIERRLAKLEQVLLNLAPHLT